MFVPLQRWTPKLAGTGTLSRGHTCNGMLGASNAHGHETAISARPFSTAQNA